MNGHYKILIVISALICSTSLVVAGSCGPHCDASGYFQNGFDCDNHNFPYCCGDLHTRYCCNNKTHDAGAFPPVYVCEKSSWWIFHWQIALGMMAVVVVVIILAACCCQCCVKKNSSRRHHSSVQRSRRRQRSRSVRPTDENFPRPPSFFSPEHPFAFKPPEYDSLPKDPPPYRDLGRDNPAYITEDETICRSPSLPSYASHAEVLTNVPAGDDITGGITRSPSLPPYTSRQNSTAQTPHHSRCSSIQSGIVLSLSPRSSFRSSFRAAAPSSENDKDESVEQTDALTQDNNEPPQITQDQTNKDVDHEVNNGLSQVHQSQQPTSPHGSTSEPRTNTDASPSSVANTETESNLSAGHNLADSQIS